MLFAQITTAGPAGEPDFADERYWLALPDGSVVEAVNVGEVIDATHGLPAGHRVTLTVNRCARRSLRHTFFARATPSADPTATDPTA